MRVRRTATLLVLAPLFAAACLSPSAPPPIAYYSAVGVGTARPVEASSDAMGLELDPFTPDASASEDAAPRELWVRRVTAAEHLGLRFVWSKGGVEFGFRELVRWTEEPPDYLRMVVEDRLFPARFARSEATDAHVVELHLRAFEEVREPERSAYVAIHVKVAGPDGAGLFHGVAEGRTPIEAPEGDHAATAKAMARSLSQAADAAVDRITSAAR